MVQKLNVGIIGCGNVSKVSHIRWYEKNLHVNSIFISDPLEEQLKECQERWRIERAYTSTEEMLKREELDVISVCSHIQWHCEHTIAAAESGVKAILCEKPMAPTLEECDEMIDVCKRNGVKLQIGFMKRFNPGHQNIKRLISEGEIGKVYLAWAYWGFGGLQFTSDQWERRLMSRPLSRRGRLLEHGGMVMDHGCHYSDIFRWWIGEVKSVRAEVSPFVLAMLRFENGAMGVFADNTLWSGGGLSEGGYLCGTDGTIEFHVPPWISFESAEIHVKKGQITKNIVPRYVGEDKEWLASYIDFDNYMFKREIDAFIKCVIDDSDPLVKGEDGRAAVEVPLAILQSADEQKPVNLPLQKSPNVPEIVQRIRACPLSFS